MNEAMIELLKSGTLETLYMVCVSTAFSYLLGIPIGVLIYLTEKGGICKNKIVNFILGTIVNIVRSIPFLILLVAILPFTRMIVGTTIGSSATIVPLVVAATPFVARLVESSLKEVDPGVIEAAKAMGSNLPQIVFRVLIPEAKASLLLGAAIAFSTILGYSAMAGFVGGGGLGAIAVNYGYYRYKTDIMLITVAVLVIIVQLVQGIGTAYARKVDKRIK